VADVLEKLGVAENVYSGFTVQQYPVLVDLKFSIGLHGLCESKIEVGVTVFIAVLGGFFHGRNGFLQELHAGDGFWFRTGSWHVGVGASACIMAQLLAVVTLHFFDGRFGGALDKCHSFFSSRWRCVVDVVSPARLL
jgi:hypothetical protein